MTTVSFLTIICATISVALGLVLGMLVCTLLFRDESDRKPFIQKNNHYKNNKKRKIRQKDK